VPARPAANSLFWTLGPNQVGRAAIAGWREIIAPALTRDRVGIWPFAGDLVDLLGSREVVFAETYPADACEQLWPERPRRPWSKLRQEHRAQWADTLLGLRKRLAVTFEPGIKAMIQDGFGPSDSGQDPFDALVSLLAMIQVLRDPKRSACPPSPSVRNIEGWIFGRPAA
jgi:hypothetical protein